MSIRFGAKLNESTAWVGRARDALKRIGEAEIQRRNEIIVQRRCLMTIEPVKPLNEELHVLHEALRQRVDIEAAATSQERAAYELGNEKQRKAIMAECKARRTKCYNEGLMRFRERVPELTVAHEERLAANEQNQAAVEQLEDAASRSRSVTQRIATAEQQLDAVSAAGLLVNAELDYLDSLGATDFPELSRTIELLYDLIPGRVR